MAMRYYKESLGGVGEGGAGRGTGKRWLREGILSTEKKETGTGNGRVILALRVEVQISWTGVEFRGSRARSTKRKVGRERRKN